MSYNFFFVNPCMHVKIRMPLIFLDNSLRCSYALRVIIPRSAFMTVLAEFHDEFLYSD